MFLLLLGELGHQLLEVFGIANPRQESLCEARVMVEHHAVALECEFDVIMVVKHHRMVAETAEHGLSFRRVDYEIRNKTRHYPRMYEALIRMDNESFVYFPMLRLVS